MKLEFVMGLVDPSKAPADPIPFVFIAGRSNSGKSSLLNALAGEKAARVAKRPGRTSEANFFRVSITAAEYFLVDLPGYGYAKVSREKREEWGSFIPPLLEDSRSALFLLLSDIRREPDALDGLAVGLAAANDLALKIVLTKRDKVGRNDLEKSLRTWRKIDPEPIVTSARLKEGIREVEACVETQVREFFRKQKE